LCLSVTTPATDLPFHPVATCRSYELVVSASMIEWDMHKDNMTISVAGNYTTSSDKVLFSSDLSIEIFFI
jgi:hypothetical protein